MKALLIIVLFATVCSVEAAPKAVKVFVALCDNKTQGIAPVGEKIGNGDDPESNLYWGCSDGFASYFKRSNRWKIIDSKSDVSHIVMRRMRMQHVDEELVITADAYRGSEIKQCLIDFQQACAENRYDLVAFIGHNGLMDFQLSSPKRVSGKDTDVIALCCLSASYFSERLEGLGCRPILMTQQLMYPGAFILHDVIESWRSGAPLSELRDAAGRAYAKNQKISVRAATGVFAPLKD